MRYLPVVFFLKEENVWPNILLDDKAAAVREGVGRGVVLAGCFVAAVKMIRKINLKISSSNLMLPTHNH